MKHKNLPKNLIFFVLFLFQLGVNGLWASEVTQRVVVDKRGFYEVEINNSISVKEGKQGLEFSCKDCQFNGEVGGPNLPSYGIHFLSTERKPTVTIEIKKSRKIPYAQISSVPVYKKGSLFFERDNKLYKNFKQPSFKISETRWIRGYPFRSVFIPLVRWGGNKKEIILIEQAVIKVRFEGLRRASRRIELDENFIEIKNPVSATYNYVKVFQKLLKKGRSKLATPLLPLVSIEVGDSLVGSLSEDGMYEVSFETLKKNIDKSIFPDMVEGSAINRIKMYTGVNGELPLTMDSVITSPNLKEIKIEVIDVDKSNVFDRGDKIRFYGHGTSVWKSDKKLFASDSVPIRYWFEANSYSFTRKYYIKFNSSEKSSMRLKTSTLKPTSSPSSKSLNYLRGEKDALTGACDYDGYDEETGKSLFWHSLTDSECSKFSKSLSRSDLAFSHDSLSNYVSDSPLYIGMFTNGENKGTFGISLGDDKATKINSLYDNYYHYTGTVKEKTLV